jgi:hypothetical protein
MVISLPIRNKNSYFHAKYTKISCRRGGNKALIVAAYHILKDKQQSKDLENNYFTTMNSEK